MSYEPQEQHLFLKCLLEANVDGIIAFDRDFRYSTWNRAMERISGVKRENVLGKNAFELFPCLKQTGEDQYYREALAGRSTVAENRPYIIAQSGCSGFFDGYYSPRHDEKGEVVGGVAIIRDVTERNAVEASTLEERRLAFHVENTPLAVIEWDHEFRVLRWSPAAQKLFGWKADEVLGKRFSDWEFVVPDDLDVVNQVGHRQNEGKELHGISRNRNYTKLGTILHCEWYNSALYNDAGKLISVLSLVLDVTVAKRIEEALRKSEAQYRLLFESNPQPMWVYDVETLRFLAVNDAAISHYGYSRAEFLEMTIKDIRPPEDVQILSAYLASATAEVDHAGEWRHRKKDGTAINVEITATRLNFAGRHAEFVLAQDVTERKRAETALRISEDRYRDLVDNSHELICTHDLDGKVLSVNPWAARVLGYPREHLVGMNIRDGLLPELRAQFDDYLRTVKTEGSARGAFGLHGAQVVVELRAQLRQQAVANVHADQVLARIAKHARGPRIHGKNLAVELVRADQLVAVVDEITVTIFADAQCCFGAFAFGDVLGQDELGMPPGKVETSRGDLDVNRGTVLFAVAPFARVVHLRRGRSEISRKDLHVFRRPNVFDRHLEKLAARVAVVTDRRIVHRQETQGLDVVNPHRLRV